MTESDFAAARILVVGAKGAAGSMLRTVLSAAGVTRITLADEPRQALDMLCAEPFEAVFVEGTIELDGTSFAMAARRHHSLLNPMIPIFAVFGGPRRRDVEMARELLARHPDVRARINEPRFDFDSPAIHQARSNLALVDVLLEHGADIKDRKSVV